MIFTAPDEAYCVGSTVALRIGSQIQPQMTQRASEALLHNLVKRQWLTDIKYVLFSPALSSDYNADLVPSPSEANSLSRPERCWNCKGTSRTSSQIICSSVTTARTF